MLRVDLVDDIADDSDIDNGVIIARDIRVEHPNFNLVDNSRIARESPNSSHSATHDNEALERARSQRFKKKLFIARVAPTVDETLLGA